MTEGVFPKIAGDIAYASEANNVFSKTTDVFVPIWICDLLYSGTLPNRTSLGLKSSFYDTFYGTTKIDSSSTGSRYGISDFGAKIYGGGSPVNAGTETIPWTSGTDWSSGTATNCTISTDNTWPQKTGNYCFYVNGSSATGNSVGSSTIFQRVSNVETIAGIRMKAACSQEGLSQANFTYGITLRISGTNNNSSKTYDFGAAGSSYQSELDFLFPTIGSGSGVLSISAGQLTGDSSPTAFHTYFDDIRFIRYTSGNLIPDKLISICYSPEVVGSVFNGASLSYNAGSKTNFNNGSFYLSADSGTNWMSTSNGGYVTFSNPGSHLRFKAEFFSSGGTTQKLYQYGVKTI